MKWHPNGEGIDSMPHDFSATVDTKQKSGANILAAEVTVNTVYIRLPQPIIAACYCPLSCISAGGYCQTGFLIRYVFQHLADYCHHISGSCEILWKTYPKVNVFNQRLGGQISISDFQNIQKELSPLVKANMSV